MIIARELSTPICISFSLYYIVSLLWTRHVICGAAINRHFGLMLPICTIQRWYTWSLAVHCNSTICICVRLALQLSVCGSVFDFKTKVNVAQVRFFFLWTWDPGSISRLYSLSYKQWTFSTDKKGIVRSLTHYLFGLNNVFVFSNIPTENNRLSTCCFYALLLCQTWPQCIYLYTFTPEIKKKKSPFLLSITCNE